MICHVMFGRAWNQRALLIPKLQQALSLNNFRVYHSLMFADKGGKNLFPQGFFDDDDVKVP